MTDSTEHDWLGDALAAHDAVVKRAAVAYEALKATRRLRSHRLLSYRCPSRCLLLDVVNLPAPVGLVLHVPRYRLSPGLNAATSNESGRANNTEDGVNHWKGWTGPRSAASNPTLTCKHVRTNLPDTDLDDDLAARHAEVIIFPNGDRSPR